MARAVVVWLILVALLALMSHGGAGLKDDTLRAVLCALLGACTGFGARTSVVIASVRRGATIVGVGRSAFSTIPVAFLAAGAGAAASVLPVPPAIIVTGVGAVMVAALVPVPKALTSTTSTTAMFLIRGALSAAVMTAIVSLFVGVMRFGVSGQVSAASFSRVLAATTLCAGLLGVGGFARAAVLVGNGVVRVPDRALPEVPGPLMLALALSAIVVLLGPVVLPSVEVETAIAIKIIAGAVCGFALHLCGGVRGVRAIRSTS